MSTEFSSYTSNSCREVKHLQEWLHKTIDTTLVVF